MISQHKKTRIPRKRSQSGGHQKRNALTRSLTILRKSVSISNAALEISLIVPERLALLCHILMNTHRLHECSTDDLKAALESDKAKIKPAGKEAILEDVWKIGRALENFRCGGKGKTLGPSLDTNGLI